MSFSGKKAVTGSEQWYFWLEWIGISPIIDWSHSLHFSLPLKNNKTSREFYKERPISTYKLFILIKITFSFSNIFDTWSEFWFEYMMNW